MVLRSQFARIALSVFCLLLLSSAACAAPVQFISGPYPEQIPSDSTPLYIWNEPLSILLLKFVCVSAPALAIPIQILFSFAVWLRLGKKKVKYKNVLDNDNRNAVYMCIRKNPGIYMRALSQMLRMNIGTTRYHVGVLCDAKMVFPEKNSKGVSYFVNTDPFSDLERKIARYLHDRQKSQILRFVLEHPGCTKNGIAFKLIMSDSSVTHYIAPLISDGIIRTERDGQIMRYHICPDAEEYLEYHEPWHSCTHPEAEKPAPYVAVELQGLGDSGRYLSQKTD